MKRRKPIKIKRRKYSLYQRKKSKGRKVFTVILMIVIVAALCVLGYGLGRPLVNYFQNRTEESQTSSAWTPPQSAETSDLTGESTKEAETSENTAQATQEEQETQAQSAFILPESAAASSETLNSALAAAKNGGYTDITVTMKDETGNFLYKTNIEGIADSQITGSLTAKQIADIIVKAGFTPRARINTLYDRTTQTYGGDYICYVIADGGIWHDYYVSQGGKAWLDPFNEKTGDFLAEITSELADAGFESVILANTMYPTFNPQDYTNFLRQLSIADDDARLAALWNVVESCSNAANKAGAEIILEMDSEDLLADDKALTTAELAGDKTKLKTASLLIDYTPDDGASYADIKAFIGRVSAMYSGQSFSVRLQTSSFSTDALSDALKAFSDSGITVYSE